MRRTLLLAAVLLMAVLLVPPAAAQEPTLADVLTDSASADTPEFTTLLAALQAADPALLEALADPTVQLTLFAPTDAAFAAQIEAWGEDSYAALLDNPQALTFILTFHLVSGAFTTDQLTAGLAQADAAGRSAWVATVNGQYADLVLDGATVTIEGAALNAGTPEIAASNGIIHVIDAVMLPEPRTLGEVLTDPDTAARYELTTLSAALQAADPAVLEALNDTTTGGFTVFAPTDAAFAVLGEDAVSRVLANPEALTRLLTYHVVSGVARSGDLAALLADNAGTLTAPTVNGASIDFTLTDEGAFINDALLVISDIDAQNGVIHIIDAVLVPPATP